MNHSIHFELHSNFKLISVDIQERRLLQPEGGMFNVPVAGSYLVTATGIVDFGWQGGHPRNAKLR